VGGVRFADDQQDFAHSQAVIDSSPSTRRPADCFGTRPMRLVPGSSSFVLGAVLATGLMISTAAHTDAAPRGQSWGAVFTDADQRPANGSVLIAKGGGGGGGGAGGGAGSGPGSGSSGSGSGSGAGAAAGTGTGTANSPGAASAGDGAGPAASSGSARMTA